MLAPQGAQCLISEIGKWNETVLMALTTANMNLFSFSVDIAYLKCQGLAEAQAHGIGCKQKGAVAKLICGPDQLFYFGYGEDIGEGLHFGGFDNVYPLPVAFQDMLPEELQAVSVNLDSAPGMGFNQLGEVGFSLFQGQ